MLKSKAPLVTRCDQTPDTRPDREPHGKDTMSKTTISPERAEVLERATLYLSGAITLWKGKIEPFLVALAQVDPDAARTAREEHLQTFVDALKFWHERLTGDVSDSVFKENESNFVGYGQEFYEKAEKVHSRLLTNLRSWNNRYNGWPNVLTDLQELGRAIADLGCPPTPVRAPHSVAPQNAPAPIVVELTPAQLLDIDRQQEKLTGHVTAPLLCADYGISKTHLGTLLKTLALWRQGTRSRRNFDNADTAIKQSRRGDGARAVGAVEAKTGR